jgi:predicted SAM-dependent methyltransferase
MRQNYVSWRETRHAPRIIHSILASQQPIFLEIGSGKKKGVNGWITADICGGTDLWMDILKPFPWPDESVDKIYSSHVFEHFFVHDLEFILAECKRILKPDGIISVCVPNAELYIRGYIHPGTFDPDKFCTFESAYRFYSNIDYVNYIAYLDGTHRHLFDQENLVQLLAKNGFRNSLARGFDPEIDSPTRDHMSIYACAVK